jgi:nuclear pore complex protein Nup93
VLKNGIVQKLLAIENGIEQGKEEGKRIMLELAAECEENARYEESIRLYEMCRDFGKVLEAINRLLGKVLTDRKPEREKAVLLANNLYQKNQQFNIFAGVPSQKIDTFTKLMTLIYFFDLFEQQRYEEALVVSFSLFFLLFFFLFVLLNSSFSSVCWCVSLKRMEHLELIPFTLDEVEQRVRVFEGLDISIQRNISDILLTTMAILNRIFQTLKSSPLYRYEPGRDGGVKQVSFVLFFDLVEFFVSPFFFWSNSCRK